MVRRVACALMLTAALASTEATAQDSHYWTEQYGNRARLLGGAMIGSSSDLSSVYYNPGRLALADEPELLLAGNVFEYSITKLEQAERGRELSSSRFSLTPSLFAGEFRFDWLGGSRLAYSFLTRNYSEFNTQGRVEAALPPLPELPSLEYLADSLRVDQRLSEYWGGITWATTVRERVGVGLSTFVAVRNQRGLLQRTTLGSFDGGPASQQSTAEYSYDHWRVLWKLGIGTKLDVWDVGLTVTTPGLRLFGSGRVAGDFSRTGVPDDPGALFFIDQQDISSTYKSPWSVGIGGSRTFGPTDVHLGVEWFDSIPLYDVLPADPVAAIVGPGFRDPSLRHDADAVVNVAAGVAHRFNERWEGYASLRTDFSSIGDTTTGNMAFTEWNLFHLSAGATVHSGRNEFTAGGVLAFGSANAPPSVGNASLDSSYFRATVILGFSFGFAEEPAAQ